MKKIVLIILTLLLIPFFILTIKDIDREEVNPTLTYNLTTTDSTYTDLNNHPLQVFDIVPDDYDYTLPNGIKNGFSHHDGKSYYIQRVQKYVLQASDVAGFNTTPVNVDRISITKPTNYVGYNVSSAILSFYLDGYITDDFAFVELDDTQYENHISSNANPTGFILVIPKGTYTSLAELKADLAGTAVYYQLATPVETELFDIDTITETDLDAWYTIYQIYHTTYTTLTLGTTTPTTYTSLQQLILDNDDKDFKLYRDDVVDETHYRLTQEADYISITNDNDLEIMRINEDDTFESSFQIDDALDYKLVGYNVTSYIDGSFDNTILAFVWIIPILLIGGFFFVIFSHRKED